MRTDYYNDPNAPEPNSVVPSASAIVTDEHGRILLVKRRDNTLWALPGGGHDIGETIADTARVLSPVSGSLLMRDTLCPYRCSA